MARNGSGTHSLPVGNPVVAGTTITPTWANDTLNDLSTEMTDSLSRSGKGGMLADLAMGGNKITGLGTPTDNTDAATKAYADGLYSQGSTTATLGTDWTAPVTGLINTVRKSAGVVTVSLDIAAGAGSSWTAFATLPVGYRPAAAASFFATVVDESATQTGYFASVAIGTNGVMTLGRYDNGTAAVVPFVIGSGDEIVVTATFAAA